MQSPVPAHSISLLQDQGWVVLDGVISDEILKQIKDSALRLWDNQDFHAAHIGRGSEKKSAPSIRGDFIHWLEKQEEPMHSLLAKIQQQLNEELWLGINQNEVHFARYDQSAGYDEHIDQSSRHNPLQGRRMISFVLYLNENWQPADGGELRLNLGEKMHLIEPLWGRLVLFQSEKIPHAVMPSKAPRWSLTGWFRKL